MGEIERAALKSISEMQPRVLQALRDAGVVFDEMPRTIDGPIDEKDWQQVAFWIYTALCEVDLIARGALSE